jgi:integrase
MAGRLTAVSVRTLRHPGGKDRPVTFLDGDGLLLQVTAKGAKSWIMRYQLNGRSREMGLGPVATNAHEEEAGAIPLSRARDLARDARALLRAGRDPIEEREHRKAEAAREAAAREERTFLRATTDLLEARRPGWRNPKHADQWRSTLESYALPRLGELSVADITTDHILEVLRPVWTRAPETASRLRQRIEAVLDAAKARGWRVGENPARWKGHLAHHLPPPRKVRAVAHHPALPWQQIGPFMESLRHHQGMAAKALAFVILTAARSGEVRGMRWQEVDLDAKLWVVPGDRMKAGRQHRVPLSDPAAGILKDVEPLARGPASLVFPGARGRGPLTDMALSQLLRGMCTDRLSDGSPPRWRDFEGRPIVVHGFRSTFRDWAGETRPEGR